MTDAPLVIERAAQVMANGILGPAEIVTDDDLVCAALNAPDRRMGRVVCVEKARTIPATLVKLSDDWHAVIANHAFVACRTREELHTDEDYDWVSPEALTSGESFVGVPASVTSLREWVGWTWRLREVSFSYDRARATAWVPVVGMVPALLEPPFVIAATDRLVVDGIAVAK